LARAFFDKLCSKPANQLVVGDRVKTSSVTNGGRFFEYIGTVVAIEKGNPSIYGTVENGVTITRTVETLCLTIEHEKYGKHSCAGPVDMAYKVYGPQNRGLLAKALEYQSTLTKRGTERKR
jgi:hypothetical protein